MERSIRFLYASQHLGYTSGRAGKVGSEDVLRTARHSLGHGSTVNLNASTPRSHPGVLELSIVLADSVQYRRDRLLANVCHGHMSGRQ